MHNGQSQARSAGVKLVDVSVSIQLSKHLIVEMKKE
jgi:hypothetical protein